MKQKRKTNRLAAKSRKRGARGYVAGFAGAIENPASKPIAAAAKRIAKRDEFDEKVAKAQDAAKKRGLRARRIETRTEPLS